MKPCVFIHTNEKQWLGAVVASHALRRHAADPDAFDVRVLEAKDYPFLRERVGQAYRSNGAERHWKYDLQSFTPLRFMPPELMEYRGRALITDPDIFAAGDVQELLDRDMQGKAILCRTLEGDAGRRSKHASSVMLLDCERLPHWHCERQFTELFEGDRDYKKWIWLVLEPEGSIGLLEPEWNDYDRLTAETRFLHNTRRETQPWKTGLPVDFETGKEPHPFSPKGLLRRFYPDRYQPHPDPNQEQYFFSLLGECLDAGVVTEATLRDQMRQDHLRHDALERVAQAPSLPA
ncbi:MAG: hypothetical protein P8R42_16765 [Candidatus Binatia bacterium]|nr:hypothetical protein [Candidatus Binatia bacterium]